MFFSTLKTGLRRWLGDDCAATAIEYGLIAGGISLVIVAAVFLTGDSLINIFSALVEKMASAESRAQ